MYKYTLIIILLTCLVPCGSQVLAGSSGEHPDDGTMLMFVGQDIELLSIASRREETPAQAPAVAEVVHREEFMEYAASTLSQILARTPGFYMAQKEWGTEPYLRGISNSVLFLYDTVPLGSELSKTLHPIDHELSLAAVKQVEIVRGPSSVLWGQDAFAGVVNVVPLSGKDFQGAESGVLYATPGEHQGAYLNLGHDAGPWDGFLSVSVRRGEEDKQEANLVSFFDYDGQNPVPVQDRYGSQEPGRAHYLDAYGRLQVGPKAAISGRFTDSTHPYSMQDQDSDLVWLETRDLASGYLKLDVNQEINLETKSRAMAYYSRMRPGQEIIDQEMQQEEETFYAEALLDRSLWHGQGLLTTGLAHKIKDIQDAPAWDSYIPDFLGPENEDFLPGMSTQDLSNRVWSVFGQYRHKLGDFDFMLGARQDFHQEYQDNLSYSTAVVWSPLEEWTWKLLYGTAYRTPFAKQLQDEAKPELEKSRNLSLQAIWQPRRALSLGATLFYNHISEHTAEDPYAGLSEPNQQEIYGLELEAGYSPWASLDLRANLTLLENSGPDETYIFKEYSIIRPDGSVEDVYSQFSHAYDSGAQSVFNLGAAWRPSDRWDVFSGLRYFGSRDLVYPKSQEIEQVSGAWLLDFAVTRKDVLAPGLDLLFLARNVLDQDYQTPGTYSMLEGEPFEAQIMLRYGF